MLADFRKVFFPTKTELIEDYERAIDLHNKQIGHCSTCVFHIPTNMPGFVTDYGDCRVNSPIFTEKVCGLRDINCSYYAEDFTEISKLKSELGRLKGASDEVFPTI